MSAFAFATFVLFSLIESARLDITIFLVTVAAVDVLKAWLTSRVVDSFLAPSVAASELFASRFAESFFALVVASMAAPAFAEPFV